MPGHRWVPAEEEALKKLRLLVKEELASAPQFPELVGERRLIRFLRGRDNDPELAAGMYIDHLKWRKEMGVNEIRNNIAYHGKNNPLKFPNGDVIIRLAPQVVMAANARDHVGQPIVLEQYGFSPKEVMAAVSIDEYIIFLIYTLEYRSMILEQLSEEMEQEYLRTHPDPSTREDGYGVILKSCCIRDLKGLGMAHLSSNAKLILQKALQLATPNYQEMLGKSHMINVPWVFNTLWQFITYQGLIEPSTLKKISMNGTDYLGKIQDEIPLTSIPVAVGGKLQATNEPFEFDLGPGGALYWPDGPIGPGNGNGKANNGAAPSSSSANSRRDSSATPFGRPSASYPSSSFSSSASPAAAAAGSSLFAPASVSTGRKAGTPTSGREYEGSDSGPPGSDGARRGTLDLLKKPFSRARESLVKAQTETSKVLSRLSSLPSTPTSQSESRPDAHRNGHNPYHTDSAGGSYAGDGYGGSTGTGTGNGIGTNRSLFTGVDDGGDGAYGKANVPGSGLGSGRRFEDGHGGYDGEPTAKRRGVLSLLLWPVTSVVEECSALFERSPALALATAATVLLLFRYQPSLLLLLILPLATRALLAY